MDKWPIKSFDGSSVSKGDDFYLYDKPPKPPAMPCRWFLIFGDVLAPPSRDRAARGRATAANRTESGPRAPASPDHFLKCNARDGLLLRFSRQCILAVAISDSCRDCCRDFSSCSGPAVLPARRARAGVPEDGTRHPQDTVLAKTTVFSRCFDVLFACCAAGTHFVHLSFRVKSAFPMAS